MTRFLRRLRARIRNRRFDDDLAEELRFHEEMKQQELESAGVDPSDAHYATRRALGNVALMREEARGVWIAPWLESVAQDVRYAVRTSVRQPLYALTVICVLVLAIGLNTSLFTFFKATALEPWPARDPDRLVQIRAMVREEMVAPSISEYEFIRRHATSFTAVGAHVYCPALLQTDGLADRGVQAQCVSADVLDVLGATLHIGRGFVSADDLDSPGGVPAVLSHHLWRSYFAADPAIVGRTIRVNRKPFVVVGVLDSELDGLARPVDLWLPLANAAVELPPREACCVEAVGRLAEGVDASRARLELQVLHERFAGSSQARGARVEVFGTAYIDRPGTNDLQVVALVWMALLLVLVLACANVGNLQLARGFARRRELTTRLAIGASRVRIVRQLLVEALVLSFAAGAASIAVAAVTPQLVHTLFGQEIPPTRADRFAPDWEVLAFTAIVSLISCMAFALAPALRSTRATIPLGSLDRGSTPAMRLPLRSLLLGAQIAACTVLLAGAGLVTRAITHAMSFDPGFRTDILRVSAFLPSETPAEQQLTFSRQLLSALERDADDAIAVASPGPIVSDEHGRIFVMRAALPGERAEQFHTVQRRSVSRNYFEVLGIPLLNGRTFASDATGEVIVNETFARAYFPREEPLGRSIREMDRKGAVVTTHTIVGVVGDAYLAGFERVVPLIFRPTMSGALLTRGGPGAVERIRAAALDLNSAATTRAWPLTDDLGEELEASRQGAVLAWVIGLLGLLLATVGVFGVSAYAVEERRREIGVRLALGAARARIVRMLVTTSGRAMVLGLGAGILSSFASAPLLRSYLHGLSPLDPVAYGLVLSLLVGAGTLATFVPARRACRVDPAVTLREE